MILIPVSTNQLSRNCWLARQGNVRQRDVILWPVQFDEWWIINNKKDCLAAYSQLNCTEHAYTESEKHLTAIGYTWSTVPSYIISMVHLNQHPCLDGSHCPSSFSLLASSSSHLHSMKPPLRLKPYIYEACTRFACGITTPLDVQSSSDDIRQSHVFVQTLRIVNIVVLLDIQFHSIMQMFPV